MTKTERVSAALEHVSERERAEIIRAVNRINQGRNIDEYLALSVVADVILARERTRRKRQSDRRTDKARRVLVGARVPRAFAERCKQEAFIRGVSLYAWVVWALEKALERPW
jgi:hypothetical protein